MTRCRLGWTVSTGDLLRPGALPFYTSESAAANADYNSDPPTPASEFSITMTATAVVSPFTVAYYNASGTEIGTGAAKPNDGPNDLTAGQTATFEDYFAPQGATSCQVIGTNAGNE
jgi:hypothetical protein